MDYLELIQLCENDIRLGQVEAVPKRLAGLNTAQVPDAFRRPLAALCRRSGQIALGLKLLSPLTRPDREVRAQPTAQDFAEYGWLLQQNGSVAEAVLTLEAVNSEAAPEALLGLAFCHFSRWDYEAAVPLLEQYLKADLPEYQRLVGKVNLCAALASAHKDALDLTAQALEETRAGRHLRLQANLLEIQTQIHIHENRFTEAEGVLNQAEKLFTGQPTHDQLFIKQWRAVLTAFQTGHTGALLNYREEIVLRRRWESVREADLYRLKVSFEQECFDQLYFGTPHPGFRNRLNRELGRHRESPYYLLGDRNAPCMDLATGEINGLLGPKPGKKIHQAVAVLLSDLYRPWSLGALFASLFPGEFYNVMTSPNRVHQVLKRVRSFLKNDQIPVVLMSCDGRYSLKVTGPFCFRLHRQKPEVDIDHTLLARLHSGFNSSFSAREGREYLGLSYTTMNKWISWALDKGHVIKISKGATTAYRLKTTP